MPPDDQDLNLLPEWREPFSPRRVTAAVIGSLLAHVVMISAVILAPEAVVSDNPRDAFYYRKVVPLYTPADLTQRDPNKGVVTHTLDVRSAAAPARVPQVPRFRAPVPARIPVPAPAVIPEPPKVEQTRIETEVAVAPPPPIGRLQVGPPPPEKQKLAFENIGAGGPTPRSSDYYQPSSKIPDPRAAAENALSSSIRPPGSAGVSVGDVENAAPSPNLPSVPGPARSNLQLLSDPKGVDFKPYLVQVLTAVRSNWLAVIPESARLGRKGRVLVQFIIDKRGHIPKLVIAESSGTAALDRAAVAGISASVLPPLPNNFTGEEIRLQLAFGYNQAAVH
jgi:TonB family protein